jgi:hypothetical protein
METKVLRSVIATLASVLAMSILVRCTASVWQAFVDDPVPGLYTFATVMLSVMLGWWVSGKAMQLHFPTVSRQVVRDEAFISWMTSAMNGPDGEEPTRL